MLPLQQHVAISDGFFCVLGRTLTMLFCHPVVIDDGYCSADDDNFHTLAIEG